MNKKIVKTCLNSFRILVAMMLLVALFGVWTPKEAAASSNLNAVYLWSGYYYTILVNQSEQARFFDICQSEGINAVFMQLDSETFKFFNNTTGVPANAFQTFITAAKIRGIEIHAILGGTPALLNTPEVHKPYIEAILKYNVENPASKFAGINWDIEHVLDYFSDYSAYTNYIRTLKSYSYNGNTIKSQGLTLSVYADAYDTAVWREFIREFDVFASNSYQDDLNTGADGGVVGKAGLGPDICQAEGVKFLIGLETDELDAALDSYTLFEEGKDRYHELESQIDNYFIPKYTQYSGQYVSHYQRAIETWHMISSVVWPSGAFKAGQTVSVSVTLRTSGGYQSSARGVELQIRDAKGTIWKTSKIVVLPIKGSRNVILDWPVPVTATVGSYDAQVIVYDLDWIAGGVRDPLIDSYAGFIAQYNLPPSIENLKLADYLTLVNTYSDIFNGYGRKQLVVLDYNGWNQALFTVGSTPPNITTSVLPNGTIGVAYSQTLTATGGSTPYNWTIASGTLPAGLSLSSGGVISGTPTTAGGPTSVTFQVTDNASTTATKTLTITVGYAAWDVNRDGPVNVLDMISISQHWGESGTPGWIPQDVNSDGIVNALDMIIIGQHWTG